MQRLPLPGTPEGEPRHLSLVRLTSEIARSVASLGRVAVEGEVVMPRSHPGGTYFTLRDRAAQVSVRCPASRAARCRVVAGERVLVTGAVAWVPDRGLLQLLAEEVAPVGAGAIAAALAERRARLAADGLLDRPRRRVPRLPRAIGVVCGTEAAVRADIESVVAARYPGYPLAWALANVSGPGAAESIADALDRLAAAGEVDVIVLARGGGDAAQLLPFSDETLCRAICAAPVPVVSAVGHEGDRPLCDEVADLRCGTPSLAAAAVVPSRADLEAELHALAAQRWALVERRAEAAGARLAAAHGRVLHPARAVAMAADRLERVAWREPARRRCTHERQRLEASARHLDALSPARVLERGYAVVRTGSGAVVRAAADLAPGDRVDVQLAAGRVGARVEDVQP